MLKKGLEIQLSRLEGFENPKEQLEQYRTPGSVAAELLHEAYMQGDIEGKAVADLGTGTGILAIGAKLLGASAVYGVDVDASAVAIAKLNEPAPQTINWIVSDVSKLSTYVDAVVMNPPFGIKVPHADKPFIRKALSIAPVAYSIHDSTPETRSFINAFVKLLGGTATLISSPFFELPATFGHHSKELERHRVDLYRMVKHESQKG